MTISADDLKRYEEDGLLVLRGFFDRRETEQFVNGWRDLKIELTSGSTRLRREARFVFGVLPDPIGGIYRHGRVVEVGRRIIGPDIALYMNRLLVKDETWSGAVEPHQDMPYFHGSQEKLSVLVPLQSFNEATGGMKFIPGSHKFGNLGVRGTILLEEFGDLRTVSPALEPGDALLMNFLTWHYSLPSTTRSDRPVLQIVYQPSTDGSYYKDGLAGPTLVAGEWRTSHFVCYGRGMLPDGVPASRSAYPEGGSTHT